MKGKLNIAGKCTNILLLGGVMMCLLSACTVNDKRQDYEEQYSGTESGSDEQGKTFTNVSGEQEQTSASINDEQEQASADVREEQVQDSAGADSGQADAPSVEKEERSPLSLEESYKAVLLDNGDFISTDMQDKK